MSTGETKEAKPAAAPKPTEAEVEATDAAAEAADAADAERERQADIKATEREVNEAAYQKSIEGQELPPSVQEEQKG